VTAVLWLALCLLPTAAALTIAYVGMDVRDELPARPAVRPEPDPCAPLHPSWLAPCDDQPDTRPDLPAIDWRTAA
jgi:hypothetical protein